MPTKSLQLCGLFTTLWTITHKAALFMGFLGQKYWSDLPFTSPVGRVLSELSAMTCLSWVALHGMAYSFIELCKPLCHDKAVIHKGEWNGN